MKGLLSLVFASALFYNANGQQFTTDHKYHLAQLASAKDSLYENILEAYDRHILENPHHAEVHLERCKFIENAYYDSYEEYNPNLEIAQACADTLLKKFPGNPEVLLYPATFLYGGTLTAYLQNLETLVEADTQVWLRHRWQVYKGLAEHYNTLNNDDRTIRYAERAMDSNDTLDLSFVIAQSYTNLKDKNTAITVLVDNLDSTDAAWDLNQKGKLLLELGVPEKAIEAFSLASKKNSLHEDAAALAKAFIDNGLLDKGRAYLLKDYQNSTTWNSDETLTELLNFDLKYGNADSARFYYDRLTEEKFFSDVFGVYRLRLFAKDPFAGWSFSDLGRILLLILALGITLLVPYLWILPIHYFGQYQMNKGKIYDSATFHWRLRHFWIACSAWLMCNVIADLFFHYPNILSYFNENVYVEDVPLVSKELATANIFYATGLLVFCIAMLRSEDIAAFFPKIRSNVRDIGVGIGLAFALRFGVAIYFGILKVAGVDIHDTASGMASAREVIQAINEYYNPYLGFLFVVILVPFYEEILFRGIFLSSCARNMRFMFANILQSLVFAAIHQDLIFFIFYFAFGLVAGHYTRKSGSLITSTAMHMMNNMTAFFTILWIK